MKKLMSIAMLSLSFAAFAKPQADIAILIDTSGSMQGLINQVRDGLWTTLNNLGEIKKNGKVADLRFALYEYGSGVVPSEQNYIQMLVPLTSDHTLVAQKLFATQAKGGTEYSGMAIQMAASDLDFSLDAEDFRSIVVAGNETIYQGPVDPITAAKEALKNDILVNTIYAGSQTRQVRRGGFGGCGFGFCPPNQNPEPPTVETEINPEFAEFKAMATAGGGATLNIDHNNSIPYIESPYDEEIISVTESISETYLPYGSNGQQEYDRMRNLDRQVRGSGAGSYLGWGDYRSGNYGQAATANWDLVSSMREETLDLSQISQADLPENLRGLSETDVLSEIKKVEQKRAALEKKTAELRAKRAEFVASELASRQGEQEVDFSQAIKELLVKQLIEKGFTLSLKE
jgi:hypothetical protein